MLGNFSEENILVNQDLIKSGATRTALWSFPACRGAAPMPPPPNQQKTSTVMKATIATLSALAIATTLSFAQDKPAGPPKGAPEGKRPPPEEVFKKIDTNGDGQLSLDEFKASPRPSATKPRLKRSSRRWTRMPMARSRWKNSRRSVRSIKPVPKAKVAARVKAPHHLPLLPANNQQAEC